LLVVAAIIAVSAVIGLIIVGMGESGTDQPRVQAIVEVEGGSIVARFKVLQGKINGVALQIGNSEPKPADSCVKYYEVVAVTQTLTRTITTTTTTTTTTVYTSSVPAGVPEYYQGQSGICRWSLSLQPGVYEYVLYAYSSDGRQIVVARGRLYVS